MVTRRVILAGGLVLAAGGAGAQEVVRLRGRIAAAEGDMLRVATREGTVVTVRLGTASIAALRRVAPEALVPGTNLGVVAEPFEDGLRAVAVTVLPPSATRQFQSAWDLSEGSSMNNGALASVVGGGAGRIVLSINGREVPMRLDERTAILQPVEASRADLRPGAAVLVNATRGADGVVTATRVTVERDGVAPAS
ncbi:hypothetical protein [Falsiroseomonas oryziterrae]|uniref:hypothetical protein n=1 Tax=Falsiroseomonas oryziterrae TaxID=2911368 RepID=UPI001F1C8F66|nr:hypothetical protein [Roseomonas sp. NPKOSM-4]